jgi:N-acetylmuramoyl-L-alanine amidase
MWDFRPVSPGVFRVPARRVTRVFLHCTDSDTETSDYFGAKLAATIDGWHKANGWVGIGYHFVVDKIGQVITGRPLELVPAAQLGPDGLGNVGSIAISTHLSKRWTGAELAGTRDLVAAIDAAYRAAGQSIEVWGHTEIDPRPCPVYPWRDVMGLDEHRRFAARSLGDLAAIATEQPVSPPAAAASWPKLPIVDHAEAELIVEGCHSADVAKLQAALGMATADVDGWFGPRTRLAVEAWQSAHGFKPTGIVADLTRRAIGF